MEPAFLNVLDSTSSGISTLLNVIYVHNRAVLNVTLMENAKDVNLALVYTRTLNQINHNVFSVLKVAPCVMQFQASSYNKLYYNVLSAILITSSILDKCIACPYNVIWDSTMTPS